MKLFTGMIKNKHTFFPSISLGSYDTPRIVEYEIPSPEFMDGLVAVFISDIHLCRLNYRVVSELASIIRAQNPDLLFIGGDLAETASDLKLLTSEFCSLIPSMGAFCVPGNNDYEVGINLFGQILKASGIELLINRSVAVKHGGKCLLIGGIDEPIHGTPDPANVFVGMDGDYKILISHYPSRSIGSEPDLILSGHTHGGQVNLFGINPYLLGFEHYIGKPVRLSGFDGRILVSTGIGTSKFPIRIACPRELYVLRFKNTA